jgi:hypothetical protein
VYNGLEALLLVTLVVILLAGGLYVSPEFATAKRHHGIEVFLYALLLVVTALVVTALVWDVVRAMRIAKLMSAFHRRFGRVSGSRVVRDASVVLTWGLKTSEPAGRQ